MSNDKEDLRVIRTKKSIRSAFEEMICEMDYEQITVKNWPDVPGLTGRHFISITNPSEICSGISRMK